MAETVDRNMEGADAAAGHTEKSATDVGENNLDVPQEKTNGNLETNGPDASATEPRDGDSAEGPDREAKEKQHQDGPEKDAADDNEQDESWRKGTPAEEIGKKSKDMDDDDPFAGLDDVSSMDIFDLSNYTFGKKNEESRSKSMKQLPKAQMVEALQKNYSERGMRRSVGAVILVHSHNFPHVLLLQRSDGKGEYALPGGRLRPGESDEEGLQRKLGAKLKPPTEGDEDCDQELDIGEKICNWYAIDFNRRYYPYVPAHVTKPKEEMHVYTVLLPSKFMFSVPKNLQLVAVPLFELFNNSSTYGDVIGAVPALLSRWHINYC